jgi:hypothetical protein
MKRNDECGKETQFGEDDVFNFTVGIQLMLSVIRLLIRLVIGQTEFGRIIEADLTLGYLSTPMNN